MDSWLCEGANDRGAADYDNYQLQMMDVQLLQGKTTDYEYDVVDGDGEEEEEEDDDDDDDDDL